MKISVLIATKDRQKKLRMCLRSILQNSFTSFEIIVVDQSVDDNARTVVRQLASKRIRYRHMDQYGNTKALNVALGMASGEIYAFTDDDCLVPKTWLSMIFRTFELFPCISGVSGQTLPYIKNKPGKFYTCPGIFESKKSRMVTSVGPTVHSPVNGFGKGTNMSFRKEVFQNIGGFKEWLGPGAIASGAGNETEFIYRAIKNKYQLYVLSSLVVFHDRWLSKDEAIRLLSLKVQGYTAFISYSMIKNMDLRLLDGLTRFRRYFLRAIAAGFQTVWNRKKLSPSQVHAYRMTRGVIRGASIGAYFALKDSIQF